MPVALKSYAAAVLAAVYLSGCAGSPSTRTSSLPGGISVNKVADIRNPASAMIDAAIFDPSGRLLSIKSGPAISIWDWQAGRKIASLGASPGGNDALSTQKILFSPDGLNLISCHESSSDGVVMRVWDTRTWSVKKDIFDPGRGAACTSAGYSPDGSVFIRAFNRAQAAGGNAIVAYDAETWAEKWSLTTGNFLSFNLAFNPAKNEFAVSGVVHGDAGNRAGTFRTFNAMESPWGSAIFVVTMAGIVDRHFHGLASAGMLSGLSWSTDGGRIAVGGNGGFEVLDAKSGAVVHANSGNGRIFTVIQYIPGTRSFVQAVESRNISWIKLVNDQGLEDWRMDGPVTDVALSRDGSLMAIADERRVAIFRVSRQK